MKNPTTIQMVARAALRRSAATIFLAVLVVGFSLPANAEEEPSGTVEFYRASGGTVLMPLWGGTGSTQQQALAQVVTMQSSQWLCSVGVRMSLNPGADDSDYLKMTIYQVADINTVPTDGTQVGIYLLPETDLPVGATPADEPETFIHLENCISLQDDATYAFTFQRQNATSERPYLADRTTGSQYAYSDGWDYIGVDGGWQQFNGSGSGTGAELHFSMQGFNPGEDGTPLIFGSYSSGSATGEDLGVFGNAIRDGLSYLFIPNEAAQNAWTNFSGALTVKVPFSYVFETKEMIDDAFVASGSMPVWVYSDGLVSSISFFSYETLTTYMPVELLALLQLLFTVALWWAFAWYVYNTVLHLLG